MNVNWIHMPISSISLFWCRHIRALFSFPSQLNPTYRIATQPPRSHSHPLEANSLCVGCWWQWFCCWLLLLWQTSIVQHPYECQPLKRHNCDNRQSTIVFCVCMCAGCAIRSNQPTSTTNSASTEIYVCIIISQESSSLLQHIEVNRTWFLAFWAHNRHSLNAAWTVDLIKIVLKCV